MKKNTSPPSDIDLQTWVDEILNNRKYRGLDVPAETVKDLILQEWAHIPNQRDAMKSARALLHNIVASYLGDADFSQAGSDLEKAFSTGDPKIVKSVCQSILASHASTKERIPLLDTFYARLFEVIGKPHTILDLACGLNPFTLPWMDLAVGTKYYAYDINRPRVDLINRFLRLQGLEPLAFHEDILLSPPQVEADVAFFFKEAHRFEQRQHGCNRPFFEALRVKHLLVSLPTSNLTGQHSLIDRQRRLIQNTLAGLNWPVQEMVFENEMVFIIEKS
jgi:16S rRNA (guanine(1405)-N(7))-methyltransferase